MTQLKWAKLDKGGRERLLEAILGLVEEETGEGFELEYQFHPTRKWRFDAAFPDVKVGLEIEGGVFAYGRHVRGAGYSKDCEKYNAATVLGWRVIRCPSNWVDKGAVASIMVEAIESAQKGGGNDENSEAV